ncbi:autotransporter outer membrane beta-barrel domain-containing protein [Pandoraea bronchicola]|uniref:Outer membrane autotransporter n=1 Tax=Pandoraea bronchicola TaxID=2508287 RepID=A0A5E5BTL0_9BURK|nr:autotransporter outer membrane beta-barrel domain-containing protein [Pandoraea bronchicola]VVE88974.1 outer membrane autotransporter [Pandoraea bronchicola]
MPTSLTPSTPDFVSAPGRRPAGARIIRTAGSTAIALALAGAAAPAWAAACSTSDTSGCGAPGGDGVPGRSGDGGAGNGQGGGSSHINASAVTVQDKGSWGTQGTGGAGATGDAASAPANAPAQSITGNRVFVNATTIGDAGNTGPDGLNFGSGGNGGNTGIYYLGDNITVRATATFTGGAGGNGGSTSNGVSGNGGGGGGGGSGMTSAGSIATIYNSGAITGGAGGAGGSGGFSGGGGAGGDGLLALGGLALIINFGTITGGAGGAAGAGATGAGAGGAGGTGVNLSGTLNSLENIGTISGGVGNGGGVGVVTRGTDSITNSGLIMGALTGGGTRAAAIEFGGTNNSLNLQTGSSILGNLLFDAGATATIAALNTGLALNNDVILSDAASGVTFSTASAGMTMSGVISGTGTLNLAGANTLTMTGANSFTGTTTISGGTLALSGSGSLANSSSVLLNSVLDISAVTAGASIKALTGTGTLRLGAQTLSLTNASGTFDGVINGSGAVRLAAGTQTLTGVNTYTGATVIDNGAMLTLSGSGSIAASGGVTNNGTLDISATSGGTTLTSLAGSGTVALGPRTLTLTNASGVFTGTIDGTGGLTLNGGTQTLSAANTYTGPTTINGGTLALTGGGRLSSATAVSLMGSGATLDISSAGSQVLSGLYGAAGTRMLVGANTLTVNSATDSTYAGQLVGSGAFVKQGAGMLVLNGASTGFTGTTTVSEGTLEVGDADHDSAAIGGDVAVGAQGILRGHGTILGNVANSGVVAPGGSIGTLRVSGNYTQASNATLSIEVSPTAASLLMVSGSATLNGVLAITYDPGTYSATRYTVVSAANGVNGRFSSLTGTLATGANLGGLQSSVAYGANDVTLLLANSTPVVIAPKNTSIYTALGTAALVNAQSATSAVLDRATRRAAGTGLATGDSAQAPGISTVWATATGLHGRVSGTSTQPGFQENQYGFLAGAQERVERNTFGLAGGYSHADLSEESTANSGTRDTLRLAAYASREMGPVDVAATVGYGLHFLSQKRPFATIGTAEGDHIGQEFTAATQASAPLAFGGVLITPRVGLRYAYFHANGFDESGAGGQNLRVGTDNTRSLQPFVGVTFDKAFGDAQRPMNVQFRAAYAHELLDAGRAITVASRDGTIFVAPGANLPRGFLTLGASLSVTLAKRWDVSLDYDALVNTARASAQAGSLKVSYRF